MAKVKFIGGERNDAIFKIAKWHIARRTHGATIKKLCRERNRGFDEPLGDAAVLAIIDTARKASAKKPVGKKRAA